MSIQEDAGELLKYIYEKYIEYGEQLRNRPIGTNLIICDTDWGNSDRINRAIKHLQESGLIEFQELDGDTRGVNNFSITGLTNEGIEIMESEDGEKRFRSTFGFERGSLPFTFSWDEKGD